MAKILPRAICFATKNDIIIIYRGRLSYKRFDTFSIW